MLSVLFISKDSLAKAFTTYDDCSFGSVDMLGRQGGAEVFARTVHNSRFMVYVVGFLNGGYMNRSTQNDRILTTKLTLYAKHYIMK